MKRLLPIFLAALFAACVGRTLALGAEPPVHRWVYLQLNLQVAENVDRADQILRRAKAAGYNGVVLADYKLNILDRVPEHYFKHAARFQRTAQELGLEIIPAVAPFGYSDGILAHDPHLAEGLPVQDTPLVVQGKSAAPEDLGNLAPGGDFEKARGDAFEGWGFQDGAGKASFCDRQVKRSGASSIRFQNLKTTAAPSGNGRVSLEVKVAPWRQFHASAWIKTSDFESAHDVRMFAIGADGRVLSHSSLGVAPTQDWREHHIVFNSLNNDRVRFYCGAWGGGGGRLWLDDVRLEQTAFVNLLRREGCPLAITTEDGKPLVEGRDYARLVDAKMGNQPYAGSFDVYHTPPLVELLPGASLVDGQRLKASYYHTVTVHENQVTCCLADPKVFEVLADQVRRVDRLFSPKTWFLSHDEIRLANWCRSCFRADRSAGELLAENVARCAAIVRQVTPEARLCIWSDMFDPHHNSRDQYYLVQGDLTGAWRGLSPDMLVVNWNHDQADKSLSFFGDRGHEQVLAGFYDSDPSSIRSWLRQGGDGARVRGVMYTTWRGDFDRLEAFAEAAWGGAQKP